MSGNNNSGFLGIQEFGNTSKTRQLQTLPNDPSGAELNTARIAALNAQTALTENQLANSQFGLNMNTFSNVVDGINAIGQTWGAWQNNRLARDQWRTQRSVLNTNMMNQIQSYNNALRDRLDSRAVMEGRSQESADRQYEERQVRRR